jgi:hypothetical protein
MDNCPIYQTLIDSILTERYSPNRETFSLFCKFANYDPNEKRCSKEVRDEIDTLLKKHQIARSFDNIEDLSEEDASTLTTKYEANESTWEEQFLLSKYYFVKMFKPDSDRATLAAIWNNDHIGFLKRLKPVLSDKDNVFNNIALENNLLLFFFTSELLSCHRIYIFTYLLTRYASLLA